MTRKVNAETLALIQRWEGLRLEAYQDVAGVWTIGYGHTRTAEPGMKITKARAASLLKADLAEAEETVERLVKTDLSDNQFGALVSFAFNVGNGAFSGSTLLRRLNAGEKSAVPAELARWNRARVNGKLVPVEGLSNRRAAEVGLWSRGSYVASNTVEPAPEAAPVGRKDVAAGTGALGAAGTLVDNITAHADTIQTVSWFLTGKGILMIGAGVILAGCLAYLAWSWWRRRRQ